MKRLSMIAMLALSLAVVGCGKKDKDKAAKTNTGAAAAPAATAPATGTGSAAMAPPTTPPPTTPPPAADPAAAGGTAPAAGGAAMSDADFEAKMQKAVAMFTAMGDAVDKGGDDCGAIATSIDKVISDNQAFIEEAKKWDDDPAMDKKGEAWMEAHKAQVEGPMMKVGAASQKCSSDAKFQATMAKLDALE